MDKNLVINEITDITVFGVKTDNGSEIHKAFLTINDGNTKSIVSISGNDYEQMNNLVQNIIKKKKESNTALNIESYSENSQAGITKLEELNNNVDMSWSMKYAVNRYDIATVKENDRTLVVQDELGVNSVTVADEEKIAQAKPSKENKHGKLAAGLAIAGIALAVACGKKKADDLAQQQAAIEQTTEMNNAVVEESNEDVQEIAEQVAEANYENWADYNTNAKETDQKAEKKLIHDYLMEFNASEDWANNVEITADEVAQYEKAGYHVEQAEDGKYYATMGLTAEQAEALRIVYGANTNQQIAKELGGAYFDSAIVEQGAGTLDQAIQVLIYNYLNTNKESAEVEKLVNFNERTQEVNSRFEKMFYEHKALLAEGKDEEAKAKFTELADALVDYAYSQNLNNDDALGKNYILNVWTPTIIAEQAGLGYNDVAHNILIYNDNNGQQVTVTVKDDYPLSQEDALNILGWENCSGTMYDENEYVSRTGYDSDEWHIVRNVDKGIINTINGVKYEKVDSYNAYRQDEKDEYAKFIENAYDNATILEFINDDLGLVKKNPMNIFHFALGENTPFALKISNYRETHEKFNLGNGTKATLDFNNKNGLVKFVPGSSYTITHTDTYTTVSESKETYHKEEKNENFESDLEAAKQTAEKKAKDSEKSAQDAYEKAKEALENGEKLPEGKTEEEKAAIERAQKEKEALDAARKKAAEEQGRQPDETGKDENGNVQDTWHNQDHKYDGADTVDTEEDAEKYNREHGIGTNSQQQEQTQVQTDINEEPDGLTDSPDFGDGFAAAEGFSFNMSDSDLDLILSTMDTAEDTNSTGGMSI